MSRIDGKAGERGGRGMGAAVRVPVLSIGCVRWVDTVRIDSPVVACVCVCVCVCEYV